ncbi:dinitrogenase iron-molybdenum cofactor biosynthesis protein [Candidatus Thorarchaeota archaeon]|nr:MAG: dinitrogenase iron-molybdenum cofactor biosynthesis protein [Candidatus Thorarchaeota archaeon]
MNTRRIAIPVDSDKGLQSTVSGHFGHCKAFAVVTLEDGGETTRVELIENVPHSSCAGPVNLLAEHGVDVLLASGMGMRPYVIAQQLGISVLKSEAKTVAEALQGYTNGHAKDMRDGGLCQGGRGAHN